MTVNKLVLNDITSCPLSAGVWLANLDWREEIWIVEKEKDCLYNDLPDMETWLQERLVTANKSDYPTQHEKSPCLF